MVIDDFGEGNPVAFMICKQVLAAFFRSIKSKLPPNATYSASPVMTDDANQYYNAWVFVFWPGSEAPMYVAC